MKRDSIKSYRAPFTFDEVVTELKFARWCSASQAALEGGEDDGIRMLGFEVEFGPNESGSSHLDRIEVGNLPITETFRKAYAFAFQLEDRGEFTEDDRMDLAAYTAGAARCDWEGAMSPVSLSDSRLSHVGDMALARMNLLHGDALTIRHLCLLANMTEPAVRSALSLEGIKTEGRPASLRAEVAEPWLRGRRGFVPTTASGADGYSDARARAAYPDLPLPEALSRLMGERRVEIDRLADMAGVAVPALRQLLEGDCDGVDLAALLRLGQALQVDPEQFVSRWVKAVQSGA